MLTTIEGVYRNGCIQLSERPSEIEEGDAILVTLQKKTVTQPAREPQYMRLGMIQTSRPLTDEDFKAAEFHGDPDDGLDWS